MNRLVFVMNKKEELQQSDSLKRSVGKLLEAARTAVIIFQM